MEGAWRDGGFIKREYLLGAISGVALLEGPAAQILGDPDLVVSTRYGLDRHGVDRAIVRACWLEFG